MNFPRITHGFKKPKPKIRRTLKILNNSIVLLIFFLYQVFEIGYMDAIELFRGNEEVYRIHNFPEILGMDYDSISPVKRYFYAGLSGVIVSWPLLLSFVLKLGVLAMSCYDIILHKKSYIFYHSHLLLIILLTIADFIVLNTYDNQIKGDSYIFRNHNYFYVVHGCAEIASLVIVVLTIIWSVCIATKKLWKKNKKKELL